MCGNRGWSPRQPFASTVCDYWGRSDTLASASGLSRTMAISISPPSFRMRAGRPACICSRIATALFSHRVRFHSSRALCAKVPVCGGTLGCWRPNARMKGLSGSVEDGRSAIAATARRMSHLSHQKTEMICAQWPARSQPQLPQCVSCLRFHVFSVPHCVVRPLGCSVIYFY